MSNTDKAVLEKSLSYAKQAIVALEEAIAAPEPSGVVNLKRDAVIQRFEFSYEMIWKLFRKVLQLQNVPASKVRTAFNVIAEAGASGWLKNRVVWEQMAKDRNYTSHEYDAEAAETIYQRIVKDHVTELQHAIDYVCRTFLESDPLDN